MERKISWILILVLLYPISGNSFFFPQFLRRQIFPNENNNNPTPTSAPRGQIGGIEDTRHQSSIRIINRPRGVNFLGTEGNSNFQVPDALCLACGSFPWTPVAGQEPIGGGGRPSGQSKPSPLSSILIGESQKAPKLQQPYDPTATFLQNLNDLPIHQHLEVTKEPGNTVIINALDPSIVERNRKPFAITLNTGPGNLNTVQNGKPNDAKPGDIVLPQFGRPIIVPYEHTKITTGSGQQLQPTSISLVKDIPRLPAASSPVNSGYVQPPIHYNPTGQQILDQKPPVPPGIYGIYAGQPPTSRLPAAPSGPVSLGQSKPQIPPNHFQNIPPITVGTILAAQQHFQIQPARLVYQEHSQIHQPHYFPPNPQQSSGTGGPLQSFRVPIVPANGPRPSGTVTINQVPLHAVPNYRPPPPYIPHFFNHQQGNGNIPPSLEYHSSPSQVVYSPVPQESYSRPSPVIHTPSPHEHYSTLSQVVFPQSSQEHSSHIVYYPPLHEHQSSPVVYTPKSPEQPPTQVPPPLIPRQPKPGYPTATFDLSLNNEFRVPEQQVSTQAPPPSIPQEFIRQKPIPPIRPYNPPHPVPTTSIPISIQSRPQAEPLPTYIPPRITGQFITSFFPPISSPNQEEDQKQLNLLSGNDIREDKTGDVGFAPPQSTLKLSPSKFDAPQPGYRLLDTPTDPIFRHQLVIPLTQQTPLKSEKHQLPSQIPEEKPVGSEDTFQVVSSTLAPQPIQAPWVPHRPETTTERTEDSKKFTVGTYEIVPATQFDITHLFTTKRPEVIGDTGVHITSNAKYVPIHVPVRITETDVPKSKAPIFIVEQSIPKDEFRASFGNQGTASVASIGGIADVDPTYSKPHEEQQIQYDPLPPSVISALHHAQRTSLLTHQHHVTPSSESSGTIRENTIFVNSVPVMEPPPEYPFATSGTKPRVLRPIAFDLNSGKEIKLQTNGNSNVFSIKTILDSENNKPEEQRKSIPVYTLQEESILRPVLAPNDNFGQDSGDQATVNCQTNQQWVLPSNNPNLESLPPTEILARHQFSSQVDSEVKNDEGERSGSKPFVYYYPTPLSSSLYWVNQDTPIDLPERKLVYGQKISMEPSPDIPSSPKPGFEVKDIIEGIKTYLAKPAGVRWSKIVEPKAKSHDSISEMSKLHDTTLVFGKNQIDQIEAGSDKLSDGSKIKPPATISLKVVDSTHATMEEIQARTGHEIVGPTTTAECITEATTSTANSRLSTPPMDYIDAGTTISPVLNTTYPVTFSPRIHPKESEDKQHRQSTRFPTGRPTIPTIRVTSEETQSSSASSSILVPVYRPPQRISTILQNTLHKLSTPQPSIVTMEDIYMSPEMKELGGTTGQSTTVTDETSELMSIGLGLSPATFPTTTNEDDEADDDQDTTNHLTDSEKVATARKVRPGSSGRIQLMNMEDIISNGKSTPPIIFSAQILPTTEISSGPTSTKIIKTVRVRQRMRPISGGYPNSSQFRSRISSSSAGSKVRIMTRKNVTEYVKTHPDETRPQTEILEEDEQKEVRNAQIDIKKI